MFKSFDRLPEGTALVAAFFLLFSVCLPGWAQSDTGQITWDQALNQAPGWYATDKAIRIADNVLLYQHESGGWPKNIDMNEVLSEEDKARVREEQAKGGTTLSNITIDNGAIPRQALRGQGPGAIQAELSSRRGLPAEGSVRARRLAPVLSHS